MREEVGLKVLDGMAITTLNIRGRLLRHRLDHQLRLVLQENNPKDHSKPRARAVKRGGAQRVDQELDLLPQGHPDRDQGVRRKREIGSE